MAVIKEDGGDYEITLAGNTRLEGTYDEIADYLTDGYGNWSGAGRHAFAVAPGGTLSADITALTVAGQQLARWALESWTNVSGIQFELVEGNAHITFDDEEGGAFAGTVASGGVIESAFVNVSKDLLNAGTIIGGNAFATYIHEIGHALGLGHPGPYNGFGDYGLDNEFLNDSFQVTVMSYFDQDENTYIDASFAYPVTPMLADIIAVHDLYGTPAGINAGDTVYGYQSNVEGYLQEFFQLLTEEGETPPDYQVALTLYDTGGNDTLDLRTDRHNQRIDLRPEGISDVYGLTGNLLIARDTWIEGAIAGHGDDVLVGNALANDLRGRAGADELRGGPGDDILEGGPGADRLDGGEGIDWAAYREADAAVTVNLADGTVTGAHAEGDVMVGIEGIIGSGYGDVLQGDAGANRLAGGPGADRLDGGDGEDWVSYRWSDTGVEVNLADNIFAGGHAEGDVIINFENIAGSRHDDVLTGGDGVNQLEGHEGNDVLEGGGGGDRLLGGSGEDIASYEHSDAAVTVRLHALTARGGDAEDDSFGNLVNVNYIDREGFAQVGPVADIEHLRGSAHADTLAGDSRANRLEGGPGDDRLYGGPGGGDDVLMGGSGNDALYGGIGDDVLQGGRGADTLRGGNGLDTASYRRSDAGVEVRLAEGTARGGYAEGDEMFAVENLVGSDYDDVLSGDAGNNRLEGGVGADRLDGGAGADWVSYLQSDAGVTVDLRDNTVTGGHADGDVIIGFENIAGSDYPDALIGDAGPNRLAGNAGDDELWGNDGDDVLAGDRGADRLHGGAGTDTLSYSLSGAGVRVNLAAGTAAGGHADGDTFRDIENMVGSVYRDVLIGDAGANRLEGAEGDDDLHGGPGADRLFGNPGDDQLYGDGGDDELWGGAGADSLYGNEGDDDLQGGDGNDRLQGNAGADRLDGGDGIDSVSYSGSNAGVSINLVTGSAAGGHAEDDVLTGIENLTGSGYDDILQGDSVANLLRGLDGADELLGNGGSDELEGGAGADRLDGGEGVDTALYRGSNAGVTVRLDSGWTNGGHAQGDVIIDIENVTGSDYDDILEGDDGVNHLAGGYGDDVLTGNGGGDLLEGGPGVDEADYARSTAGVLVNLEQGAAAGGHAEGDILVGVENITGSTYRDVLIGDNAANNLSGLDGDDEIYGGAGDDILRGGAGADRLDGGDGSDMVYYYWSDTGVAVNLATGTAEGGFAEGDIITDIEQVWGSDYADRLVGDDNGNTLSGSGGDDELSGAGGNDSLAGHEGNDLIYGDDGDDWMGGFNGDDELHGGAGHDWMEGGMGEDRLYGGPGRDWLVGGMGADRLTGGAGNDTLYGYTDRLDNEESVGDVDVFVFDVGHGDDVIYRFFDNEDKIDLSAFNLSGFDELNLSYSDFDPPGTMIDLSAHGGGTIVLFEFDIANLDATDFLF